MDGVLRDVNRAPAMLRTQRCQLLKKVGPAAAAAATLLRSCPTLCIGARGGLKRRGPVESQCRS